MRVEALSHKRVLKVVCGAFHTLVLTEEKELYTFGSGNSGECGHGDNKDTLVPKLLSIPKEKKKSPAAKQDKLMNELLKEKDNKLKNFVEESASIIDIAAGGKHSIVLTGTGSIYTFGFGDQGQLGHRDTDN